MKLSKEKLKQIIKEELEATLSENEVDDSPLDDLIGPPLSPEERKQFDADHQKIMQAEKIVDIVFDMMDKGLSKEEAMQILKRELDKY